jgi:hypothetical protein
VFSFMQDLGCFDGIPWAKSWINGQNRGQILEYLFFKGNN